MSARNRSAGSKNTPQKLSQASSSNSNKLHPQQQPPPPPFTAVPEPLTPLLDHLDPKKVYIIHVDAFPWQFKRQIFAVPVCLNLAIAVLLLWRAWAAWPTYASMVFFLFSTGSNRQREWADSWSSAALLVAGRVAMVTVDLLLARVVGPWPITFFFEGPANPCSWRWNVGFSDQEAVVRVSRGWGTEDLIGPPGKAKRGAESPFWKTRVLPAVGEALLKGKTGYALMGKDWDLEFEVMVRVTEMVDRGVFGWADLRAFVLAWDGDASEGRNGWVMWRVGGEVTAGPTGNARVAGGGTGSGGPMNLDSVDQEQARQMMERFRAKLVGMGKEDLFFRWVELMQYEASLLGDGGVTAEKRAAAVARVRELFRGHGVEYGGFLEEVGGLEGVGEGGEKGA